MESVPMVETLAVIADLAGSPPDDVAELLVAVAHDNRDRDVWGGDRALTYWDRFPDRVRAACYAGPTLADWWERITRDLGCGQPTLQADRIAVAAALGSGRDDEVREVLRTQTETLCLRVRIAMQTRWDTYQATKDDHD